MPVPAGAPDGDLARRVADLIRLKKRADGSEFTRSEIAEGVSAIHFMDEVDKARAALDATPPGSSDRAHAQAALEAVCEAPPLMHRTYVGQLLDGRKTNPTMVILQYLAKWFDVPPAYFFDGPESEAVRAEFEVLSAFSRAKAAGQLDGVHAILRATDDMTPRAAKSLFAFVLSTAQGLRTVQDDVASDDR